METQDAKRPVRAIRDKSQLIELLRARVTEAGEITDSANLCAHYEVTAPLMARVIRKTLISADCMLIYKEFCAAYQKIND